MSFEEYEAGILRTLRKPSILDNAITRDLFFLGKALGKKYDYLRLCYNIFMIGTALTVVLAVILLIR